MFFPTSYATMKTMQIAHQKFPGIHHLHNPANAFRHALWNALIAYGASKWSKKENYVMAWTEKITLWHEDFSPNRPLERTMDLHNNQVGRSIFLKLRQQHKKISRELIVSKIYSLLTDAMKIEEVTDPERFPNRLVYIDDYKNA